MADFLDESAIAGFVRQMCVVLADHCHARGRWGTDDSGVLEYVNEALHERERFAAIAGVEMHLAAAGLRGKELNGVPQALQHMNNGLPRLWEQRVVVTGDERGWTPPLPGVLWSENYQRNPNVQGMKSVWLPVLNIW